MKKMRFAHLIDWLLNSGLFYLGWVITIMCVLEGESWKGILLIAAIIGWHLFLSSSRLFEAILIASIALCGPLFDTLLALSGILYYHDGYLTYPWLPPLWIQALWALFATSLNHSLSWVSRSYWLAALLGAVGGTCSYLTVIKVGAVDFAIPEALGIFYLACGWSLMLPLCCAYNFWLKNYFALHIDNRK